MSIYTTDPQDIRRLVNMVYRLLETYDDVRLQTLLELWPDTNMQQRVLSPSSSPVEKWIDPTLDLSATRYRELISFFKAIASKLTWLQTYKKEDLGERFIQNSGFVELMGSRGPYSNKEIAVGVFILGPETLYPLHSHESEEFYFPLIAGTEWKQGESDWFSVDPGGFVYNPGWVPHAIQTGAAPVMALYLWHGPRLAQKSTIH